MVEGDFVPNEALREQLIRFINAGNAESCKYVVDADTIALGSLMTQHTEIAYKKLSDPDLLATLAAKAELDVAFRLDRPMLYVSGGFLSTSLPRDAEFSQDHRYAVLLKSGSDSLRANNCELRTRLDAVRLGAEVARGGDYWLGPSMDEYGRTSVMLCFNARLR